MKTQAQAAVEAVLDALDNPYAAHGLAGLSAAFQLQGPPLTVDEVRASKAKVAAAFAADPAGAVLALGPALGGILQAVRGLA